MNAYALPAPMAQPRDPGTNTAFLLAVAVHALLFVFLFFGISWNTQRPAPPMAELWSDLPNVQPPAPVVQPKPEPELPKPVPKVEPKPEPKPEPKIEPKVTPKPDIALEQEKERKKKEAEAKAAAEKKKADEARLRRELAEAERKRLQQQLESTPMPSTAPIKGPAMRGDPRVTSAAYIDKLRAKIRGNIVLPSDMTGNPEAIVDVEQLPTGEVLNVKIRKSSGVKAYDDAVERAVLKSSPLPLPEKGEPVERNLKLTFRPIE